jgi:hypothetical protein
MGTFFYTSCIKIVDTVYQSDGTPKQKLGFNAATGKFGPMEARLGDEWDDFCTRTVASLKWINDLPSGRKMLEEINDSGNMVIISGSRAERLDLPRGDQLANSCYSAETAAQFYQPINTPATLSAALVAAAAYLRGRASLAADETTLFGKLRDLVGAYCGTLVWGNPAAPWNNGWQINNVIINSASESFLKFALEAFLQPGGGAPATIRWHPDSTQFASGMRVKIDKSVTAQGEPGMGSAFVNRPAYLALAHELIHAWRAVCGRCFFASADIQHDEHVTVGLLPRIVDADKQYTGMAELARTGQLLALLRTHAVSNRTTENRMRAEAKVALRPVY